MPGSPRPTGSDGLTAVVFDVDGTLVDSERDGHRVAFNQAFEAAGLPDRWDVDRYGRLLEVSGGKRRLSSYFGEQGMAEGEREELARRLHESKTKIFAEMAREGRIEPRPGVSELLDELQDAGIRLAVATTGGADWVHPLLDRLFGPDRFEVIVTSDDAPALKPDPAAYRLALARLELPADSAIAVEDSENGVRAARSAELKCVVIVNDYTRDQDFVEADLVLDGFGSDAAPASVLADPHRVEPPGRVDLATLREVLATAAGSPA